MAFSSDFLMRRFLGEHLSTANDEEPQSSREQASEALENPNLQDLPQNESEGTGNAVDGANPFWSERAQDEYHLRQMRPTTLPPLEEADPWEALGTQGQSSVGSDNLMLTAREMDRQTSIGRFSTRDAVQFLQETGQALFNVGEPDYFNMAAGDLLSSGSCAYGGFRGQG